MTKLEELKAALDAATDAYAAAKEAAYGGADWVALDADALAAAYAARNAAWVAYYAACIAVDAAYDAYQKELEKQNGKNS